jgi:16S rRNA (cytosine1402-N4)-methyltransferase
MMRYHEPVMLREAIEGLNIRPDGVYVDLTFGGGGHSSEILARLDKGTLYAFDQDTDAQRNKLSASNFILIQQNFRFLKKYLKFYKAIPVDGILADLGISSHQIDVPERGFSTRFNALLDMRMNTGSSLTARDIVNSYTEKQLQEVFSEYGEITNSKKLAAVIYTERKKEPLDTVDQLKKAISSCVPKGREHQYYAQLFQALRIEVNDELGALKEMLLQSAEVIAPGGRLVVISYHSLEDRLVKNYISKGKFEGEVEKDFYGKPASVPFQTVIKKPLTPSEEEVKRNPRARSAKMRIAEKL